MGAKKVPPNGDGSANPKAGSAAKETDPESAGESATAEEPDQDIVEQLGALVRKMRTSGGYKERGERIVAIERPADHGRPAESVRFNYCTYQGHPYFSVRVWRETPKGWVPDATKGLSIRVAELEEWAGALTLMIQKREAERGKKKERLGEF